MSWQWLIAAILILVGLGFYVPTIYIRQTNRALKVLEQIERNTRYAVGTQSIARYITRALIADSKESQM